MRFRDRTDAGRALATMLQDLAYPRGTDPLVLALPRGGAVIGREVARALRLPLDVFVVRKLGLPGQEELAMGAIASGGVRVINHDVVAALELPHDVLDAVTSVEREELERRERIYRVDLPPRRVSGRSILLVDDGIATGSSVRAAVLALRRLEPESIAVAAPVAARPTATLLRRIADDVICVKEPQELVAVGWWYEEFQPTTDEEVHDLLVEAARSRASDEAGLHGG